MNFLPKKDIILNFVDCDNVEVDLEEPNSDPLDDPLEPEVQEIKIEDVKIEFEGATDERRQVGVVGVE